MVLRSHYFLGVSLAEGNQKASHTQTGQDIAVRERIYRVTEHKRIRLKRMKN